MKRASRKHSLKTWPESFSAIKAHKKTFDVRRADRDFREGDTLILREFAPCGKCKGKGIIWKRDKEVRPDDTKGCSIHYRRDCCKPPHGRYTGRRVKSKVTFVYGGGQFGIEKNFVVLGIACCDESAAQRRLALKHGTPAQFESAVWKAFGNLAITAEESNRAIEKYKSEWSKAGRDKRCG